MSHCNVQNLTRSHVSAFNVPLVSQTFITTTKEKHKINNNILFNVILSLTFHASNHFHILQIKNINYMQFVRNIFFG